ncbi:hypothetical protein [Pseudoalteromonas tunicata]|jgi:hypothetical protein|uniref:Orphan protein n=1 Tax=Pseudoalteromonas tunicata D2 TaxID=87626 RepID=A4C6I4_9GAMM|nr:hypothetical protein [Pseudoalteromonas tunicata]ATC95562.1 hypothetical protein PTUN_a3184 [Pseudoalteromonas tunicata]AXT31134.1 hypothetical protein D1819_10185 [Pseudoalteromonas tunicata]EAR29588.1 hypothetical protein PTD2_12249 [Pseudoalteromonas tunicata D2]MDP4984805.1 hypothetical protein [Pseudoalteromonas tunicata]
MKNSERCFKSLMIAALFISLNATAENRDIILQKISNVDFDTVNIRAGSCNFDSATETMSGDGKRNICSSYKGSKGVFKLTAEPNKLIEVEFKSTRTPNGLIQFNPKGVARSDFKEYQLVYDVPVQFMVGTSGIVDIEMGGELEFFGPLNHSSNYSIDYDIKYKYIEVTK